MSKKETLGMRLASHNLPVGGPGAIVVRRDKVLKGPSCGKKLTVVFLFLY